MTASVRPANRTWLAVLSVAAIALGLFGLATAPALTAVVTLWVGILMAVVGVVGLINTLRRGQRLLGFALAAVYLLGGLAIAFNPLFAAAQLTLLIAAFLVTAGLFRLVWAGRSRARALAIPGALMSILLGGFLMFGWPISGLYAIGIFVAVDLILFGATGLAIALSGPRPQADAIVEPMRQPA